MTLAQSHHRMFRFCMIDTSCLLRIDCTFLEDMLCSSEHSLIRSEYQLFQLDMTYKNGFLIHLDIALKNKIGTQTGLHLNMFLLDTADSLEQK